MLACDGTRVRNDRKFVGHFRHVADTPASVLDAETAAVESIVSRVARRLRRDITSSPAYRCTDVHGSRVDNYVLYIGEILIYLFYSLFALPVFICRYFSRLSVIYFPAFFALLIMGFSYLLPRNFNCEILFKTQI